MVLEHEKDYPSRFQCAVSIASKMGMHPDTLAGWVRREEVDHGGRQGITTSEREEIKKLERENRELRRANEILKAASIFFATELDGRPSR